MFKGECFYSTWHHENAEVVREFRSIYFFFCEHTISDSLCSQSVWNLKDLQYFDWHSWRLLTEFGLKTSIINDSFFDLTRSILTPVLLSVLFFAWGFIMCFQTHLNEANDFQRIIINFDSRGVQARSVPAWKDTLVNNREENLFILFLGLETAALAFALEENRRMFWLEDSDLCLYFLKRYLSLLHW